jgi:uncharacterized protein (TIGR02145 family)
MIKNFLISSILITLMLLVSCEDDEEANTLSNNNECSGTFIDERDGREYHCVTIGNQVWMSENLAFKVDSGGCWSYEDNDSNVVLYGYLYNWSTANLVAPEGWHLPSDNEWKELESYIGLHQLLVDTTGWRGTNEGGKLKEIGTEHWLTPNTEANNTMNFNAIPGGERLTSGTYVMKGMHAFFWTSTITDDYKTYYRCLNYNNGGIVRDKYDWREYGFSVRCIKD